MAAGIASRYKTEPRLAHPVNQLTITVQVLEYDFI